MFQDYCAAHGLLTSANSLYCSEECRELEVKADQQLFNSNESKKNYHYDYNYDYNNPSDLENEDDLYEDLPFSPMEPMIDDLDSDYPLRSASLSSASSNESSFLYECCLCNSTHSPNVSCNEVGFHDNFFLNNLPIENYIQKKNSENLPPSLSSEDYQNSLKNNHELILSNYRKWLVNIGPN